ncbi:unnamed protein product [Rotaria magnacalcarata]|uniref:GH18 domain-containing protein n=3 Tax=Rotaria magnacalcarata TaxID=392030 RepID=A0A8S2IJQ8_9BILA|nr:unnamed protein product [Rotaria magnacalcarata]CAF3789025.1 unnamed protein product [Rotaria magnacalcarata]
MNNDDDDDDNYPGKLLHQAALYLNVDLLQDLLVGDEINNIDAIDRFGCTPLHTACISAAQATLQNDNRVLDSSLEFIMVLIDHGADLNVQTGERYDYKKVMKLFIVYILLLTAASIHSIYSRQYVIGCYFTNWSQYRQGLGHFSPSHIDPSLCTHVFYAFANINVKTRSPSSFEMNDIKSIVDNNHITSSSLMGMYGQLNLLKNKNRHLKTLLSLGGATVNATEFRYVFEVEKIRHEFIRNTIRYLRKYKFDGLDIDWEYPETEKDRRTFSSMVRDYRLAFQKEASTTNRTRLLLTAAVAAYRPKIEAGYNIKEVATFLDFINLMAYDYHGSWNTHIGFNSPLYPRSTEIGEQRLLNQQATVNTWLKGGCPPSKLVLGLGFYGRTFKLKHKNIANRRPYASSQGAGLPGNYTNSSGFLSYYEICNLIRKHHWQIAYDREQEVPFAYKDDQWVGFDNQRSVEKKCQFIAKQGLAGAMIWAIDLDDFTGNFCGQGKYPLLTKTPIHMIAEVGNEKILALLLFHKADVTIRDKHGYTPLLLAQINRKVDTVEMIQNEIELRQQVRHETEKKLLDACFDGDVAKAEECLAHLGAHAKAVLNSSPNGSDTLNFLYRACRTGNVDLVKLLLKHGAIAKPHRQTSYSPLYIACRIGNLEIVHTILTHFPHLVCVATLEQILPFAAACSQGHLPIVQLLLTYPNYPFSSCSVFIDRLQRSYVFPFNLNAQDLNEQTSLYLSVLGGYFDVVECLLSFRVHALTSPEVELFKRRSTHSYFTSEHSIVTLSEFNATLQKTNSSFCPFNLDIYSNTGRTALHEAIEQQNFKLVHLLVSNGANVNLSYEEISSRASNTETCFITRSTALSCACRLGNIQLIEYLMNSLATDKEFLAFNACKQSYLIGHLLKYRALQDNEFKLTKRQFTSNSLYLFDEKFWSNIDLSKIWINTNEDKKDDNNNISETNYSVEPALKRRPSKRYQILTTSFEHIKSHFSSVRPFSATTHSQSSPIPSIPVGIQWHQYGPLKTLDPLWFIQASIFVNKDTFTQLSDITVSNRHLLFHCITRIDLSDNSLESLPIFLLQMYSLRILNVSNNQLGELPNDSNVWLCHQLTELDVSHNALTYLPSTMFQLRSLQRAYAAHNQLQYLPVEMWSAPMLTDLNVANNSLKELPAPTFVAVKNGDKSSRHLTSRHSTNQSRTTSEFRSQATTNSLNKQNINEVKPTTLSSSVTTANLSACSPVASAPPRSTTFAQIAPINNIPPSPDDEDELERRSQLKIAYENPVSPPPVCTPVKRLCLWQNHITQSTHDEQQQGSNAKSSSSSASTISRLNNLNLSYNQFEILPPMLCCLTPYLTSLNLSHNILTDPSTISSYPPRLKMLDLSFNRLTHSILVESLVVASRREKSYRKNRHFDTTASENICFRPELKEHNSQSDMSKRRRSRSVSRHKVLTSTNLTVGINSLSKSDQAGQCCSHRRHSKLELLHDLNLSDNKINELSLLSIVKPSPDMDITVLRSSLLFPVLTRLNLSQNELVSIPSSISLLENLGTLILRGNLRLKEIPLSIGSMQKLWNLDLHGCGQSAKK